MRANFNRQTRRVALCIEARERCAAKRSFSPGKVSLTACDDDLVLAAERIDFELPAELVDLLSATCLPTSASLELPAAVLDGPAEDGRRRAEWSEGARLG